MHPPSVLVPKIKKSELHTWGRKWTCPKKSNMVLELNFPGRWFQKFLYYYNWRPLSVSAPNSKFHLQKNQMNLTQKFIAWRIGIEVFWVTYSTIFIITIFSASILLTRNNALHLRGQNVLDSENRIKCQTEVFWVKISKIL